MRKQTRLSDEWWAAQIKRLGCDHNSVGPVASIGIEAEDMDTVIVWDDTADVVVDAERLAEELEVLEDNAGPEEVWDAVTQLEARLRVMR